MKTMFWMVMTAALCATSPALATPTAKAVAEAQRTLDGWFSGYEFVPEEKHYKRLGEALPYALLRMVVDPDLDLLKRARAVSALVYTPGPVVEEVLVRIAEDDGYDSLIRRKALLVLADNYGARHATLAVNVWASAPSDLLLREASARALRDMGPEAYAVREALLFREKAPSVRALLNEEKNVGEAP